MAEERIEAALVGARGSVGCGLPMNGGEGGVPFSRSPGDGPCALLRGGDGPTPFCFGGGSGPIPLDLMRTIRVLPPITGVTTVTVNGIVRMYYMLLFGYAATTIGVADGVQWYLDYSGNPKVIKMLQNPEVEIVNQYNRIEGKLVYRFIESVWQPIIVVESWAPPVKPET